LKSAIYGAVRLPFDTKGFCGDVASNPKILLTVLCVQSIYVFILLSVSNCIDTFCVLSLPVMVNKLAHAMDAAVFPSTAK
jgi:hypothetical protein